MVKNRVIKSSASWGRTPEDPGQLKVVIEGVIPVSAGLRDVKHRLFLFKTSLAYATTVVLA